MESDRQKRLSELYHAALERAPDERVAFLKAACSGDEVLREELESLLLYASGAARFLERLAAEAAAGSVAVTSDSTRIVKELGPYKITAPLGVGGMGEVYRARDTRLGRDVAIKILPSHFTADPERRARFAREARVLATLNHPNIGAIYGLEEVDGITALVLELVEGPTLADRLERGPVKVSDALVITRQIAEALDAAHERGIVHRDLKPANIVLQGAAGVTQGDVRARVLDFGLAKSITMDDAAYAPTVSLARTADGRILGTPAYMSPEQARGLQVDKRTDIWAFGCVLFEMLSGRRAFEGDTVADTTACILDREPDWAALPVDTPHSIRTLLERCLRKDTRKRLRDIADAVFEIDDVIANAARAGSANARAVVSPVSERARRARLVWVVAGTLSVVVAGASAAFLWSTRGQGSVARLPAVADPALVRLTSNPSDMSVTSAHISSDGRHLAFADPVGLQVRIIDSGKTHLLPGTKGMDVYGWTPDSSGVLASQCDELSCSGWIISLVGQERQRTGAVWPRGDQVRVAPDGLRLLRLALSTNPRTLIVDPMNGASVKRLASGDIIAANWSADGNRVLFVRRRVPAIESVPAEGGTSLEVFRAPKDQVILDVIELPDRSVIIAMMPPGSAPGPSTEVELWKGHTDEMGVVREAPRRLTWAAAGASHLHELSASTTGGRVALLSTVSQTDVYLAEIDRRNGVLRTPRRFTLSDRDDVAFDWTPDSSTVLLDSTRNGTSDIFKQPLEIGVAEPLLTGPRDQSYPGVTSDGRWVLYVDGTIARDDSIMRVPLSGGAPAELLRHVGRGRLQCAPHGRCVLLESKDGSFVISSLDPLEGRGVELARTPLVEYGFRVLPDGGGFAYILPPDEKGARNRVRVISFSGKPPSDIVVNDATRLSGLTWLPSDHGFLVADRGKLLLVSRNGVSKVLWAPAAPVSVQFAVPSPDEKHLAINVQLSQSNAWMMSGF
jgi:serine/threonine protein kinase